MLFRRRAGAESRRRRFRRHFRSNCVGLRRIAMRIGAGFPDGCCDKSCTLFRRLRRICALADIVCSGGTCDDLRTRDIDGRRSPNVRSLRIFHPLMARSAVALALYATQPETMTHRRKLSHAEMQSRFEEGGSDDSQADVEMESRFASSNLDCISALPDSSSDEKQQQQQRNDNIFIR